MRLFLILIISIFAYYTLTYYGITSWIIWITLVILWMVIDYFFCQNPLSWKEYTLLVIVISIIEIGMWYNYFGLL